MAARSAWVRSVKFSLDAPLEYSGRSAARPTLPNKEAVRKLHLPADLEASSGDSLLVLSASRKNRVNLEILLVAGATEI